MKKHRIDRVSSLLTDLDSSELRELKKQFNEKYRDQMHTLERAEELELKTFVDSLNLDRGWRVDSRDVVSLKHYGLPREQQVQLNQISEAIGRAFKDLSELKLQVARDAKNSGKAFSEVFHTSVKRMKRYQNR